MRNRFIAIAFSLMILLVPSRVALADGSNICAGDPCKAAEVGPFMQNISDACGNLGTCTLEDIQIVFENVANYILGIVGALVLLMYVLGGMYFLMSGMPGQEKLREKGKTALKVSTTGLIIVFGAFALMHTIFGALQGSGPGGNYESCGPGATNEGKTCAENSVCNKNGLCVSKCVLNNENPVITPATSTTGRSTTWKACENIKSTYDTSTTTRSCSTGSCPGPSDVQCCTFTYTEK